MKKQKFDCILSAGFPVPALKHGDSKVLQIACIYTLLFNILDMPTTALPIGLAKEGEDQ